MTTGWGNEDAADAVQRSLRGRDILGPGFLVVVGVTFLVLGIIGGIWYLIIVGALTSIGAVWYAVRTARDRRAQEEFGRRRGRSEN
jgi:hypothetical protein